ncbi:transposase, partial [Thiotrichales bacterium 19S3-11]|nr:transposase [Thiotrichales bacterium 19S3-11]
NTLKDKDAFKLTIFKWIHGVSPYLKSVRVIQIVLICQSCNRADNAAFHKKEEVKKILQSYGHDVLFLPPYSPDFNPIEQDFATMKKRRMYAKNNTSIDEIVRNYGLLLE